MGTVTNEQVRSPDWERENGKGQRSEREVPDSDSFRDLKSMSHRLAWFLVSASEIFAELPKLSREERRRLAAAIFELEEEADVLRDCDHRADEHFHMLDVMEEKDAQTGSR